MDEQRQLTEQQFNEVVSRVMASAPDGLDEAGFTALLDQEVAKAEGVGGTPPRAPAGEYAKFGPMSQLMRDAYEPAQNLQELKDNAPAIGATIAGGAATLGSGGILLPAVAAAGGGYLGSRARGDDRGTAATEGAIQGAIDAGTRGGAKVLKGLSKIVYNTGIPKAVLDKFRGADIAGAGLSNRAILGTSQGVNAAERAGAAAGNRIQAAAPSVQPLSGADVAQAFGPRRAQAVAARKLGPVSEIDDHVQAVLQEMGPTPMSGAEQLARKTFLEAESKPAMTAVNSRMAATNPQLANIERRAVVSNLRRAPQMASALNDAQASVGLKRAAGATENSTILNRLRGGGLMNAAQSPMVSSMAGIAGNEASKAMDPNIVRLLMALMSEREE